jgi:hypothetical protein
VQNERRYTKRSLLGLITAHQFSLERCTYANTILFPILAIRRIWQKRFIKNEVSTLQESDVTLLPKWVNKLGVIPMMIEAFFLRFMNLPFGHSLVVLAKKNT